jgi:hypothetical protein
VLTGLVVEAAPVGVLGPVGVAPSAVEPAGDPMSADPVSLDPLSMGSAGAMVVVVPLSTVVRSPMLATAK